MAFFDEARITVISGKGGNGCSSFRREKYIPKGGPDGGDGGKGGDVIAIHDKNLNSLINLKGKKIFSAQAGKAGSGKNMKGESGEDLMISLPNGTLIYADKTGELIGEITDINEKIVIARGGKGGLGNARFKSSTNQSPRKFTEGEESDKRDIMLELRLIADVGLLGLPNAGKSTLINYITNSKSKIGSYAFTTLGPELGVMENDEKKITIADLPGIISGASEGQGLGIKFLKHAYRTRFLLHLVDGTEAIDKALISFDTIEKELDEFHLDFSNQKRWLCITKTDLIEEEKLSDILKAFQVKFPDLPIYPISSLKGEGLENLKEELFKQI
jgi:GTP-binding protein|tara:strand:+ start:572 stop:1561 length:990 start_codon:yes stop_codon:yes gene_type:complete